MKHKLINDGSERSFALVFEQGDAAMAALTRFARAKRLEAARFTGIGAFSGAVLGFFDLARKDYQRIAIDEQVEVVWSATSRAAPMARRSCTRTSSSPSATARPGAGTCSRRRSSRRWS